MICTTRLGDKHSCEVSMKSLKRFRKRSEDKILLQRAITQQKIIRAEIPDDMHN